MSSLDLLISKAAAAVQVGICPDGLPNCPQGYDWKTYVIAIYYYAVRLGAVLVVLMLIYGGYTYIISQGDSTKLTNAKDRIFGAVIGYLLLLIVGVILKYLGLDEVK
ncbi:MAG: hypothetical protein Q7S80_00725 [bacterium]|nr:hypothetical protein [bacterium]